MPRDTSARALVPPTSIPIRRCTHCRHESGSMRIVPFCLSVAVASAECFGCGNGNHLSSIVSPTPIPSPTSPTPVVTPTAIAGVHNLRAVGGAREGGGGVVVASSSVLGVWELLASVARPLSGVAFLSDQDGWAVGSATLLRTSDGGRTWDDVTNAIPPDGTPALLRRIHFSGANSGIAVGAVGAGGTNAGSPLILFTRDSGEHWETASISGDDNPAVANSIIEDACVTATKRGVAVGFGTSGPIALRSTDAGQSWVDITQEIGRFLPDQPHGVACIGDSSFWIVGGGAATVVHSGDAGVTWSDQTANTPALTGEVLAVSFTDDRNGLAAGVGPFLIATDDGGSSWTRQSLPSTLKGGLASIDTIGTFTAAVGIDESTISMQQPIAAVRETEDWQAVQLPHGVLSLSDVTILP